jgi:NMD protein affecting ribosome stability and mRNA decay
MFTRKGIVEPLKVVRFGKCKKCGKLIAGKAGHDMCNACLLKETDDVHKKG